MPCTMSSRYHIILALSLLLPIATLVSPSARAIEATSRLTIAPPIQISLKFKVPKRGAPSSTAGGASRGACLLDNKAAGSKNLTSLMPPTKLGLTWAERPSFFVYVPQSSARTAGFLLLSDDDTEIVYETTIVLPSQAGVLRFDLPADAPPIQVGKQYHWFMTTLCDTTTGLSGSPTVEGWLERSTPDAALRKTMQKTLLSDRPALYAEAGIWYETLATLADLQRQAPQNSKFRKDWQALLQSVGLEAIATEPLLDCCRVTQ